MSALNEVRVIDIWEHNGSVPCQHTDYQGTQDALIESGAATPAMFNVGKSGTKNNRIAPELSERFCTERRAKGQWRITRYHRHGEPPFVPIGGELIEIDGFHVSKTLRNARVVVHAHTMWCGPVQSESSRLGNTWITSHSGTRSQLIHAGLACADMFPRKQRSARVRKSSPEHQGDWSVRYDGPYHGDHHHPLSKWCVTYHHEAFEMPPEVKIENKIFATYKMLKRRFGDDDGYCYG